MQAVDAKEYLDTVCQLLDAGQRSVPVPVAGDSMRPFLQPGDTVFLDPVEMPLKAGQMYLFLRPNGQYVLHRLLRAEASGRLWMLGDNQQTPEPVRGQEMLRGQVVSLRRNGKLLTSKSLLWRFFAGPWLRQQWLRGTVSAFSRTRQR